MHDLGWRFVSVQPTLVGLTNFQSITCVKINPIPHGLCWVRLDKWVVLTCSMPCKNLGFRKLFKHFFFLKELL